MNLHNEFHNPIKPDFQFIQPNAVRYLPHSIETGSRWQTYGSSSGWGPTIMNSALGEYAERKHFYLDVTSKSSGTLELSLSRQEVAEFVAAFTQTRRCHSTESIEEHIFSLARAYRVTDFSPCEIPTACIIIGACQSEGDNIIVPLRDTCGCATHETMEKAIHGALIESIERQQLQRFWLTRRYSKLITQHLVTEALSKSLSRHLYDELNSGGEVAVFDISDSRFPGKCVIICYGDPENKDSGVNYCTGMSYSPNLSIGIEKALVELWQTFRFMKAFTGSGRKASDLTEPYIRHFMQCNNYATYLEVTDCCAIDKYERNETPLTTQSLIECIKRLKLDGYLYMSSLMQVTPNSYFCKYVSPNIFLHMNNSSNINMVNRYSRAFMNEIDLGRAAVMVPFP